MKSTLIAHCGKISSSFRFFFFFRFFSPILFSRLCPCGFTRPILFPRFCTIFQSIEKLKSLFITDFSYCSQNAHFNSNHLIQFLIADLCASNFSTDKFNNKLQYTFEITIFPHFAIFFKSKFFLQNCYLIDDFFVRRHYLSFLGFAIFKLL